MGFMLIFGLVGNAIGSGTRALDAFPGRVAAGDAGDARVVRGPTREVLVDGDAAKPEAKVAEPEAKVAEPEAKVAEPEAGKPEAKVRGVGLLCPRRHCRGGA